MSQYESVSLEEICAIRNELRSLREELEDTKARLGELEDHVQLQHRLEIKKLKLTTRLNSGERDSAFRMAAKAVEKAELPEVIVNDVVELALSADLPKVELTEMHIVFATTLLKHLLSEEPPRRPLLGELKSGKTTLPTVSLSGSCDLQSALDQVVGHKHKKKRQLEWLRAYLRDMPFSVAEAIVAHYTGMLPPAKVSTRTDIEVDDELKRMLMNGVPNVEWFAESYRAWKMGMRSPTKKTASYDNKVFVLASWVDIRD